MPCPTETDIADYACRTSSVEFAARMTAHVADCAACRQLVFALANAEADEPQRERIGRFVVEGVVGHGAMGSVYEARDPELQRPVAIKVLARQSPLDSD